MARDRRTKFIGRCLVGELDEAIENATQWPTVGSVFYSFKLLGLSIQDLFSFFAQIRAEPLPPIRYGDS